MRLEIETVDRTFCVKRPDDETFYVEPSSTIGCWWVRLPRRFKGIQDAKPMLATKAHAPDFQRALDWIISRGSIR